tara:strand:+ start:926 stop:1492 length:567 start_codon:yes stop_codon:yes gene_type:complete
MTSNILNQLWSPIAALTSHWEGKVNAQICVGISNASIVPEKPRVLVQIYKENYSHILIAQSGAFALNFLSLETTELIKAFGFSSGRHTNKLENVPYTTKITGSPILDNCIAYLDCKIINALDAGDMTCYLADVLESDTLQNGPLLRIREAREAIPGEWNIEWDRHNQDSINTSREIIGNISYTPWQTP